MFPFLHCSLLVAVFSFVSFLVGQENVNAPFGNTTVVILNWSRPFNVHVIVSGICEKISKEIVPRIVIWNNNPITMQMEQFIDASCPKSRLRIVNSEKNLYFQARYMACAESETQFCFIQDDDYFILPEIIESLIRRMNIDLDAPSAIHLQPPHEMLSSVLRTLHTRTNRRSTFAWLGYGTIIKRSKAIDFLALLDRLNLSDEQHKMADNYFTILSNDIPERWFDSGIPLYGGVPFTVGSAGEMRNNRHIIEATKILQNIVSNDGTSTNEEDLPYIQLSSLPSPSPDISRAPCHGHVCIFSTSVQLLPAILPEANLSTPAHDILEQEQKYLRLIGDQWITAYVKYPPSNAVDRVKTTAFISPKSGIRGEWISLDLTVRQFFPAVQLVLELGEMGQVTLQKLVYDFSVDGSHWTSSMQQASCLLVSRDALKIPGPTFRCVASFHNIFSRYFRVRLIEDVDQTWQVFEMYISNTTIFS